MTQSTLSYEGAFTKDTKDAINANFTDLYAGRAVTTGDSATLLSNMGLSKFGSSAATTFTLTEPVAGSNKYLECIGATANVTLAVTPATIGTTFHNLVFTAADQVAHLYGESTAKWIRVSVNSTLVTTTT